MRIVLAYAPSEQQFIPVPPLGIATLSSYLKEKYPQFTIDTIDLELELWITRGKRSSSLANNDSSIFNITHDEHLDILAKKLSVNDIICFSIMGARQLPYLEYIIKKLETDKKDRKIIIGGALITEENSFDILNMIHANYAIVGEGWNSLCSVINIITNDVIDDDIVIIESNEKYLVKHSSIYKNKLLPMADYSEINLDGYILQQKELYKLDYDCINYQILVGDKCCPYNCSFCRISKNTDKIKPSKFVAEEMLCLNDKHNCQIFSLICNEMNPTKSYLSEFVDHLLDSKRSLKWFCYLRPNQLSSEDISKLRQSGCLMIRFGVESGSQRMLDGMNKCLNVEEIEQILKDTHLNGIWNHINIMTGYLYETDEDIEKTIQFLRRNKEYIDSVRINPFYIPINSPIHLYPEKFDIDILENTGSYIKFSQKDLNWEDKKLQIKSSTNRVLSECIDLGIGFAGILPNLLVTALSYFANKSKAKQWLKDTHPYLWFPISPDTAKWKLAHPERNNIEINSWSKISGERGDNYKTIFN